MYLAIHVSLVRFSKLLKENFCDDDLIARIGGDEFLVVVKWLTKIHAPKQERVENQA